MKAYPTRAAAATAGRTAHVLRAVLPLLFAHVSASRGAGALGGRLGCRYLLSLSPGNCGRQRQQSSIARVLSPILVAECARSYELGFLRCCPSTTKTE